MSWKFYHEANTATGLPTLNHFTQYFTAQPGTPLYDKAMANSPVGSFEHDVANDQLPTVSWLLPPAGFDEHPNASPAAGATYVAAKIDALAANPEVWAKTVFILSYDENDGFFDHVIPPVPPPGTPDEYVTLTPSPAPTATTCPSAPATGCPASSCRRGPLAAGCAPNCPITPRSYGSLSTSPA